jgi:hypothetical protein
VEVERRDSRKRIQSQEREELGREKTEENTNAKIIAWKFRRGLGKYRKDRDTNEG